VSAETLRKQMRIGSMRARALVQQVRDSHDPAAQDTEARVRAPQQMGSDHRRAGDTGKDRQQQAPDLAWELAAVAS
jgi:hypothetical protein